MSSSPGQSHKICPGPISRRSFLEIGSVGLGGLALADLLRLRAEASLPNSEPDTSVILVWLAGGLPHMEMYDMKPEAPAEYRGELRPVKTNVRGMDVCELMPLHTKIADRFSLIRSITHEFSDHGGGHKRMMTGRIPRTPVGSINDAPAGASITAKMREQLGKGMPNNVVIADDGRTGVDVFALGSAYLGPSYDPFEIPGDPSSTGFQVRNLTISNEVAARLGERRLLLDGLDTLRRDVDRSGAIEAMDKYSQRAYQLLTNEKARAAFDLSLEDAKTRDRYGNHSWGQRALLARRWAEAGSSFVTVILEDSVPGVKYPFGTSYNWDCHALNCHLYTDLRYKLPRFDQATTALIEDIHHRGLDKQVLVVVMGEFGHTPRINTSVGAHTGVLQPGRDHWPQAQSVLIAGGGLKMGQVVGSTNSKGEVPKDRPLTPNDLWATIYRHLGIDYTQSFVDHAGRPMPILPFGEPIRELVS